MVIIEYKLDPQDKPESYHPKTIPDFVADGGGNWQDPDTYRMIGIQVEGSTLPDTATVLTLAELQARQRDIHSRYPMKKYDMPHEEEEEREITDDEVNAVIKEWWDARP